MKNLLFLLLSATLLTFFSCGQDDDCNEDSLENVIVGEWRVTALGLPVGDVEFNANGTFVDEDDLIIDGEIGGVAVDEKTYVVNSNDSFTLRATQGSNAVTQDVDVISFNCDEIDTEIQGFSFKLNRK